MNRRKLKLWQHDETGRFVWSAEPGRHWHAVPTMREDELPELMDATDYDWWLDMSHVINGVRMGPKINNLEVE